MTPKLVTSLAITAAISIGGAYLAYSANNVFVPRDGVGEKVLAGFGETVNDVVEIKVEHGLEKLALIKRNDRWEIKETGYPVSAVKVKKALIGLVELSKLEAKTANAKKYLLISVDEPGKKDGRGRQFTLLGQNEKPIARIILGKTAVGKAGPGRDASYVRVGDEKTSWLALGSVEATAALPSWVEPRFLKIDVDSVTYGRVETAGEKAEVRRTGKSDSGSSLFELLDVPEGRKPRTSTTLKFLATDLVNLDLIDVRPIKQGGEVTARSFVKIETGMELAFKLVEEGDKGWVSLEVLKPGSDQKTADDIKARTAGWEFLVANHKRVAFRKRKQDLLLKAK